MPEPKKETINTGSGRAIVSDKVRSHENDPTFLKRAEEAKEALSKIDLLT